MSARTQDQLSRTVIVVEGGWNDRQLVVPDLRDTADEFVAHLVESALSTRVVPVGTAAPVAAEQDASATVNAVLAQSAARHDVTFVDPIGPDWFSQDDVVNLLRG